MKKSSVIVILFIISFSGYSQMRPATQIPPDITEKIKIKAPVDIVWDYLLSFDNIQEFGTKIIEKSVTIGQGIDAMRVLTFKNGSKRTEEIAIIAPDAKKIGVKVLSLGETYSRKFYYFELTANGSSRCLVTMKAYYALNDETNKKEVAKAITTEFEILLKGLKNYFEN